MRGDTTGLNGEGCGMRSGWWRVMGEWGGLRADG